MNRLLIIGDTGLVGKQLVEQFIEAYDVVGLSRGDFYRERYEHLCFDIEKDDIRPVLNDVAPSVIISTTRGVFDAQYQLHRDIVDYVKANPSVYFIFFSTANVFDGDPNCTKSEFDKTDAISDYGKFKIKVENMIRETIGDQSMIVRLPMVFGNSSARTMNILEGIAGHEEITAFRNLIFNAITVEEIVNRTDYILSHKLNGIYHMTSVDTYNHHDFYNDVISGRAPIKLESIDGFDAYYLALRSDREDLKRWHMTNGDVINYLRYIIEGRSHDKMG